MKYNYNDTIQIAKAMIEFHRLSDILKDNRECEDFGRGDMILSSTKTEYSDGDIEYRYRYRGTLWLETFTVPMHDDCSHVYEKGSAGTQYTYVADKLEFDHKCYESGDTLGTYETLLVRQCTEEMYEQLQYVYDCDIVHYIFIISLMQGHGFTGTFSFRGLDVLTYINQEIAKIWQI